QLVALSAMHSIGVDSSPPLVVPAKIEYLVEAVASAGALQRSCTVEPSWNGVAPRPLGAFAQTYSTSSEGAEVLVAVTVATVKYWCAADSRPVIWALGEVTVATGVAPSPPAVDPS